MKILEKGIFLETKPAEFHEDQFNGVIGHKKSHAFLVYRDGKGGAFVLRGGPGGNDSKALLGSITLQDGRLSSSKDGDYDLNPPSSRKSRKLHLGGRKPEEVWSAMQEDYQRIAKSGFPYKIGRAAAQHFSPDELDQFAVNHTPRDQNSNSVIASHLKAAGIDLKDALPEGVSKDDLPGITNTLDHNPDGSPTKITIPMEAIRGDDNGNKVYPDWMRDHDGGKPTAAHGAMRRGKGGSITAPMPKPVPNDAHGGEQSKVRSTDEALPSKQADPATRKMMDDFLKEGDPADEAMLKSPGVWTQAESEAVMKKRLAMKASDPDYENYVKAERAFFDTHYGNDTVKTDETGKTLQPQAKTPLPLQATPVQTPDGVPLNSAIAKVGEHVTAQAQKQGRSKSIRGLQAGLNLLPSLAEAAQSGDWKQAASATVQAGSPLIGKGKGAQIAQTLGNAVAQAIGAAATTPLKTDGVAGPKTVQAARTATARHGASKVKEATALGVFSEATRDPSMRKKPEALKATVDNIIGPLFGDQKAAQSNLWGKGFQAAVNDTGADVLGPSYEPIKEDGWIGPKTTGAFNQVASAASPMDFAKRFGQGLGFL